MKTIIAIYIGHCDYCQGNFEYIPGKINSVTNRNSDLQGVPRCPRCNSYTTTRIVGQKITHVWSIRKI